MYEAQGVAFLAQLSGCYTGVLVDRRKNRALLFNDRHGLERIYFRGTQEGLYFASEAKALLRVFEDSRRLDPTAVAEMISVGCVMQGRTLFPGVEVLPPATCVEIEAGRRLARSTYFSPSTWENQEALAEEAFHEALRDALGRIIPRHLRADRQVAMSLTGGLDGRIIMAWAGAKPGALPCYSFAGMYRHCHDVRIAKVIAKECGQPHRIIEVGKSFLARFPELASRTIQVSDGTMDVGGAVEVFVNEEARELAPLRITGNYGSEIMRGNVAFRPRRWASGLFEPELVARIDAAGDTYREERKGNDLSFIAFKQVPWHHHSRYSVERSQIALRSPFLDSELVSLMYRSPAPLPALRDLTLRLIHDGNPGLARIPTDRGLVYGPQSTAGKVRNAIREFSAKAEYAYDYGMPQRLASIDRWLRPLHPELLFLGRHKFYHFRVWYRDALAGYLRDTLLRPRAMERSCFKAGVLRNMVESHTTGRANYTLQIHLALTFELIQQELLR
jgi:asparagine synthase (glutamine-hydrolysing)